jgi:hypothetical protein
MASNSCNTLRVGRQSIRRDLSTTRSYFYTFSVDTIDKALAEAHTEFYLDILFSSESY